MAFYTFYFEGAARAIGGVILLDSKAALIIAGGILVLVALGRSRPLHA